MIAAEKKMKLWKIEVFENTSDREPIKTGFFYAKSESDASHMAKSVMGDAWRVDFCTTITGPDKIPEGFVAWVGPVSQICS
jgi:hypothetical protein